MLRNNDYIQYIFNNGLKNTSPSRDKDPQDNVGILWRKCYATQKENSVLSSDEPGLFKYVYLNINLMVCVKVRI